ncbi:MAG: type II toxin-antitoxin system HicB family antitoxin [Ignavibacteria bacterium]|nr:type II toxin-antitoxin system HicB family antitoxin [Ignavibacteria bacterium]
MDSITIEFNSIIVKEEEGGYSSLCLDLDVASQGDTIEEAKAMLVEAVEGYIEVSLEKNLSYLRPVPDDANPELIEPGTVVEKFKIKTDLKIHSYA